MLGQGIVNLFGNLADGEDDGLMCIEISSPAGSPVSYTSIQTFYWVRDLLANTLRAEKKYRKTQVT